jgi:hypothetical protein
MYVYNQGVAGDGIHERRMRTERESLPVSDFHSAGDCWWWWPVVASKRCWRDTYIDRKKEDKKKREEVDVTPMESGRVDSPLSCAIPCTSHCIKNRVGYTVESNTILYRQHPAS